MAGTLWRQKLEIQVAAQVTVWPGYDYQPDWSPDGKSVVYASIRRTRWNCGCLIGEREDEEVDQRWGNERGDHDGRRMASGSCGFRRSTTGDSRSGGFDRRKPTNIVRLTGERRIPCRAITTAMMDRINPVWTRDGKEISFVSNRGHIHGTGGFWRMKAEPGAEAREIHYEEKNESQARPDFSR